MSDLDRFSVPMAWEGRDHDSFWDEQPEEKVLTCAGCGDQIYVGEENIVESEIWEDDYMHDHPDCISTYYKRERAAVVSNSN